MNNTNRKHSLDYIIESWVSNLDVEPYEIGPDEASEYATYIGLDDTDDTITPEVIMEKWNNLINKE